MSVRARREMRREIWTGETMASRSTEQGHGVPLELQPFTLTVIGERSHPTVIVKGELDLGTAPQLRVCLTGLPEPEVVEVDLAGVTFMDSTALGVLLAAFKHYRSTGGDLRVIAASGVVAKVLEISGLAPVLGVGTERA